MNLTKTRNRANNLLAERTFAARQVRQEHKALAAARRQRSCAAEARRIVQAAAQHVQRRVHRRIAAVVSRCLRAVFSTDAYRLKLEFVPKRGKTEAKISFVRAGLEVDPLGAAGGGAADVAAFGLRLACLMLARPRRRKLLVLDEPMKFVSAQYRPAVVELIWALAVELGVQFIMVTHSRRFEMGEVIRIDNREDFPAPAGFLSGNRDGRRICHG